MFENDERIHDKIMKSLKSIELVSDTSQAADPTQGFLCRKRYELKNHYHDNTVSRNYLHDIVYRHNLDAVGIALYRLKENFLSDENIFLLLRKQLRPGLYFRNQFHVPLQDQTSQAFQYEIVAGIIETKDVGETGILSRAKEEAFEEAGVVLETKNIFPLGHAFYPSSGVIPEKLYLYHAEIPKDQNEFFPQGDGSAVEEITSIEIFSLSQIKQMIACGLILDAKTIIAAYRLKEILEEKII